jgi:AcrR family transcriptional regulator
MAPAREMLAEQGADTLTMDAQAARAGLGKGTVFRRFGARAGIFHALLDDDERIFQEQVLAGPLDGPLLLYLSESDLTEAARQIGERIAQGWQDLVQRVGRP